MWFCGSIISWEVYDMPANSIGVKLRVGNGLGWAFMVYFWSHFAPETDTFREKKSAQIDDSDSKKFKKLFFPANEQIYRFSKL